MRTQKQKVGRWGEQQAASFLIKKGYTIIQKNFYTRAGEIDIIAWDVKKTFGRTLCFIEVKTRQRKFTGDAQRATRGKKIQHMKKTALYYCLRKHISIDSTPISFEQVSIYYTSDNISIQHQIILE